MKSISKYLVQTCMGIGLCLLMVGPAVAQRGAGGGGRAGGGGGFSGGGHAGGGFSGGGARMGGGFSGRPSGGASFNAPRGGYAPRGNYAPRVGFQPRGVIGQRSNIGNGQRTGVRGGYNTTRLGVNGTRYSVNAYHGSGLYGHGGDEGRYGWGRHNGYFYNRGYYGNLYYPYLGLWYWSLPYGCYPFWWGNAEYYYGEGYFYQYNNDQYTVVEPPVGAEITSLPKGAQSIVINGEQYYELNGVYYLLLTKDDGSLVYQVTGKDGELNTGNTGADAIVPKVGDIVTKLPPDCRKVHLNGATFFVSADGIYYQETKDSGNNTVYKIVGLDDDGQ
ncbi:DUF6515 family protein [uncultured Mucilaginibacter sp.]|uniref:DUF6515 family protein n=1 Tax=uncultured Mucilaginibacter sp. TaxID=797541 RepID=UPI0025FE7F5D|nr:DUF6515 family protein [uncultured Mucilaginibacter sp.]